MQGLSSGVTPHKTTILLVQGGVNILVSTYQHLSWTAPAARSVSQYHQPPPTQHLVASAPLCSTPAPLQSLTPLHYPSHLPQAPSTSGSQPLQCSWTFPLPLFPVHVPCPRPPWRCLMPVLPALPAQTTLTAAPGVCITLVLPHTPQQQPSAPVWWRGTPWWPQCWGWEPAAPEGAAPSAMGSI